MTSVLNEKVTCFVLIPCIELETCTKHSVTSQNKCSSTMWHYSVACCRPFISTRASCLIIHVVQTQKPEGIIFWQFSTTWRVLTERWIFTENNITVVLYPAFIKHTQKELIMDFKAWYVKQKMEFRDTMQVPMHLQFGSFKETDTNNW